jgi:malate dehydrogenase (quinone)
MLPKNAEIKNPDVVLVGAGIMSATLGMLLKQLQPDLTIEIFEILDGVALESSDAWNNAGTGHAALCELNYSPQHADGTVDCSKAFHINESFLLSLQFWAYLVETNLLKLPQDFIRSIPHMSFVRGKEDVDFLRKRFEGLKQSHLFRGMEYSEDSTQLTEWMPLVMRGRDPAEKVAATHSVAGTDVNFGALTRSMISYLNAQDGVSLHLKHEVQHLERDSDNGWQVQVKDKTTNAKRTLSAKFVFLGAGGGALPLLQKSNIPEGKGFGGFPVSGQWLRCSNPDLIEQHHAKVYGKASVGAPPMSVPHLDARMISGEKGLLFGPFAGFTTKYLKNGSPLDFPFAIHPDNFVPMTAAGLQNIPLTTYLIGQVLQSPKDRLAALREFLPEAKMEDWALEHAGQRVQVIKKDPKKGGVLQFGTEIISASDGSLSALLGASPGASTAVAIMIDLLCDCFSGKMESESWKKKLKQMIPSYGESLAQDEDLHERITDWTHEVLGLETVEKAEAVFA